MPFGNMEFVRFSWVKVAKAALPALERAGVFGKPLEASSRVTQIGGESHPGGARVLRILGRSFNREGSAG